MDIDMDLKIRLLHGLPIEIDDICRVFPVKLSEVSLLGFSQYQKFLANLVADVEDFNSDGIDLSQYSYWDILIHNISNNKNDYGYMILNALCFFLKEEVFFSFDKKVFFVNKNIDGEIVSKIIDQNIFEKIRYYLKIQNCIENKKEKSKFSSKKAREIFEKMQKGRDALNKANGADVSFGDIISTISANSKTINIFNIWDLTIYVLYDQFYRMQMIEDYDINIKSLLAGAQDIELKHYLRPIDIQN